MAKRSAVEGLPSDAKAWIDRELIKRGFSGYEELAQILSDKGFSISKSSVHRYGQKYERQQMAIKASVEAAKAITDVVEDDDDSMGQALINLTQHKLFTLMIEAEEASHSPKELAQLARSIAQIQTSSIRNKKYRAETRKEAMIEAAKTAKTFAKEKGLSADMAEQLRKRIAGLE